MRKSTTIILLCLLAFVLSSPLVQPQGMEDFLMTRSKFFIDHAIFADSTGNRLELYYKIFNDGLHYVKRGDKYIANFEINVIVIGDKDKQVTGRAIERTYAVDSYELTRSDEGFLINQLSLTIPEGDFELVCKLIDHNSNTVSTIEAKIKSPAFKPGGDVSTIQFIQDVGNADPASPFFKNGLTAVPAVERTFDSDEQRLGIYAEIYAEKYVGSNLRLNYEILGHRTDFRLENEAEVAVSDPILGAQRFIDLRDLSPGDYRARLILKDNGRQIAQREERFSIKWSLSSLLRNDFEYAVEQLKYLIKSEDKKRLLALPDSSRIEGFEAWWDEQDPTPNTPENEKREEYYRRIRYSNQYFATINREGWQTDRGMIYIRHGEPDQIDRYPFETNRKPSQIWRYYTQRLTFVFVDTRGDGDYQLQYPYDGDWRHRGTGLGP